MVAQPLDDLGGSLSWAPRGRAAAPSTNGHGCGGTREHVRRMRSLPVEQVTGDIVFSLLNAAQVKLGRETPGCCSTRAPWRTSTRVPIPSDELTKIDQVLGQLRLGQVSAEGHASRRGEPEANDLDRVPTRRRLMQRSHLPTGRPASCGFLGADPYRRCVSYSPSPPLAGDLGFRRRRVHPAGG